MSPLPTQPLAHTMRSHIHEKSDSQSASVKRAVYSAFGLARDISPSSSTSSSQSEDVSDVYSEGLDFEAEGVNTEDSSPTSSRASVIAVDEDEDQCQPGKVGGQVPTQTHLLGRSLHRPQYESDKSYQDSTASSPLSSSFSLAYSSPSSAATSISLHQPPAGGLYSHKFQPPIASKNESNQAPVPVSVTNQNPSSSLAHARALLEHQAASLLSAARRMREEEETWKQFQGAQDLIVNTLKGGGKLVWTGVGKSGIIASKLSSTSLSLGLPSTYLDPLSALHGDLGLLNGSATKSSLLASSSPASLLPSAPADVLIALSHSGSSPELLALLPHVDLRSVKIIALTAQRDSKLGTAAIQSGGSWVDCRTAGRGGETEEQDEYEVIDNDDEDDDVDDESDGVVAGGSVLRSSLRPANATSCCGNSPSSTRRRRRTAYCSTSSRFLSRSSLSSALTAGTDEADPELPAPTSSTTTALVMGDSLVLSCAKVLGLGTTKEFGKNHPGGALGKRMMAELKLSQGQGEGEEEDKEMGIDGKEQRAGPVCQGRDIPSMEVL